MMAAADRNAELPIQALWIGGRLSNLELLSIRSFKFHGHSYHLYTYDGVENAPAGVEVKDANEILHRDHIKPLETGWGIGSLAGAADIFRIFLLHRIGGWWVDTDIVCLKPFQFAEDTLFASTLEGSYGKMPNNCVMKLPAQSAISGYLHAKAEESLQSGAGFGALGPLLIYQAVRDLGLANCVAPVEFFCPISWRAALELVYEKPDRSLRGCLRRLRRGFWELTKHPSRVGRITHRSFAVHLWNEIWRQNSIDKNASYHSSCLYEKLKRRYIASE